MTDQPTRRWLCVECMAEGGGNTPDTCPACGSSDSWFAAAVELHPGETMRDRWEALCDELLGSGPEPEPERTDAEVMAQYARDHFGMVGTDREIGVALLATDTSGPRRWTGLPILRSLGVFVETRQETRPN